MSDKNTVLVCAIEKFPCLYNHNISDYSKKEVTEKAWNDVAEQTQLSVGECKEKWKNLRNGLIRSLRPGPDGTIKKKYYLHEEMTFVLPFIRTTKASGTIIPQEDDEDDEITLIDQDNGLSPLHGGYSFEPELHYYERPRKISRRKLLNDNISSKDSYDNPRIMFLLSLYPEINALTENQMKLFRRKVLALLDDITNTPNQLEAIFNWQKDLPQNTLQNIDSIKTEPR